MGFIEFISKMFGNKATRDMREIQPWVQKIKDAYPAIAELSNDELRARTIALKEKIKAVTAEERKKIEELKELEELIAEAQAEAEQLKDEIKAEMLKQNTEEMTVGKYIVRWTTVLNNRFDSTAFKRVMPEVYKAYTKQVTSRRFSVS